MPTVDLDKLESILYRENSCIDPQDVARLMQVVCDDANVSGPESADWLDKFRAKLHNQVCGYDDVVLDS